MKTIITIFFLLVSLLAFGQDTALTSTATISLPKGSKKVTKQQYLDYAKAHFKKKHEYLPNDHAYLKDNMLVTIRNRSILSSTKKTLENWKNELEGAFKESNTVFTESKIITVNNNRFLIFEYSRGDENYLSFYSDYIKGNSVMALIDYKQTDKEKAHQYLQTLLQNIRFRKNGE